MYNAFLVLFKAIMRNGREGKIGEKNVNGGSAAAEDKIVSIVPSDRAERSRLVSFSQE